MNKRAFPNPLFLEWLKEWRDAAAAKGNKSHHTYERAIRSLQKYPLVLPTGKDCRILANFGEKICQMLDDRLSQHQADFGNDVTGNDALWSNYLIPSSDEPVGTQISKKSSPEKQTAVTKVKKGRVYIPQPHSGPYAILLTLLNDKKKVSSTGYMSKARLMKDAQPLSEKSFKHPDPGSRYTAWSSMGTLIKKGLVEKTSSPARYCLTEAGSSLAQLLLAGDDIDTPDDGATRHDTTSRSTCSPQLHLPTHSRLPAEADTRDEYLQKDVELMNIPLQDRLKLPWQLKEQQTATVKKPALSHSVQKASAKAKVSASESTSVQKTLAPSSAMTSIRETSRTQTTNTYNRTVGSDTCQPLKVSTITSLPDMDDADTGSMMESSSSSWQLDQFSYDIILCVDNQELHGNGAGREVLLTELRKNKVAFDVRKLQVGDFLWVARDNTGNAGSVELVLDYIVERKRMDDLAGSIIDGRFSEQKYRLASSNIGHVIYLIESYGSAQHFSIPEDTLMQAITNTQVVDGFFVKQTGNANESAAYLTLMTRYLQSHYAGKPLLHAPNDKRKTCGENPKLRTFEEFSIASVKTKATTVREMLCKQLLQLHGMTAEKVSAITDMYSTPRALYTAYQRCQTETEKENMLANLKAGTLQRSVGKSLSKAVSMIYCMKQPAVM